MGIVAIRPSSQLERSACAPGYASSVLNRNCHECIVGTTSCLVYLVIRKGLRVTKGGELLQIADVKFSGRSRRGAEVFKLLEWQRLTKTINPIVEWSSRVREPHPSARARSQGRHQGKSVMTI